MGDKLQAGKFYWAQPDLDVDAEHEWMNEPQPALYLGNDRWVWIGYDIDTDDWDARWVGELIEQAADPVDSSGPIKISIALDFNVPEPYERKTTLTNQQIADKVFEHVEAERNELVQSAKIAAIKMLNGEDLDDE